MAFPAISARQEGYEVFVVADASGTLSAPVRQAAHDRMILHGCQMISSFALACELFRDWRNNGDRLAYLCKKFVPAYASVMDSFNHAIAVPTRSKAKKQQIKKERKQSFYSIQPSNRNCQQEV